MMCIRHRQEAKIWDVEVNHNLIDIRHALLCSKCIEELSPLLVGGGSNVLRKRGVLVLSEWPKRVGE